MFCNIQLNDLLPLVVGTTKKEIASRLDSKNSLFLFSVETGITSYHNYNRNELLEICIKFGVDPVCEYVKMGRTIVWQKKYAEVTGTIYKAYNENISQ